METTPLQLYKKAYELHYSKKQIKEAGYIYKELISNFPDTEVSNYASIQLSKIISNNIDKNIPKNGVSIGSILVFSLLIINTAVLAVTLFWLYSHIQFSKTQNSIAMKTAQSISNIYAGNEDVALNILKELKYLTKDDITPYEISANIYLKQNQFKKARNEYKSFQILYPDNRVTAAKMDLINNEEIKFKDNLDFVKKSLVSQPKVVEKKSPKSVNQSKLAKSSSPKSVNQSKLVKSNSPKPVNQSKLVKSNSPKPVNQSKFVKSNSPKSANQSKPVKSNSPKSVNQSKPDKSKSAESVNQSKPVKTIPVKPVKKKVIKKQEEAEVEPPIIDKDDISYF